MNKSTFFLLFCLCITFACKHEKNNLNLNSNPNLLETKGCGDFWVVSKLDSDKLLNVSISYQKTQFSTEFQALSLAAIDSIGKIYIEQNAQLEVLWSNACNDVFSETNEPSVEWILISADVIKYKVSEIVPAYNCMSSYKATIILENAIFQKENSTQTLTIDKVEMKDVKVGWCAG
jgi:general stress protein 26